MLAYPAHVSSHQPPIAHREICDGEPDALAALCARHGIPVLAYCEHVAAPRKAALAAVDAFAQLRASIFAAADPASEIDVEALLLTTTRRAASAHGVSTTSLRATSVFQCAGREPDLVAQLERRLEPAERQELEEHVSGCEECARAAGRLEAGRRAFDSPPRAPLPAHVAELLVAALAGAAPLTALGGDADAVQAQTLRRLNDRPPETPAVSPGTHWSGLAKPNAAAPTTAYPDPNSSVASDPSGATIPGIHSSTETLSGIDSQAEPGTERREAPSESVSNAEASWRASPQTDAKTRGLRDHASTSDPSDKSRERDPTAPTSSERPPPPRRRSATPGSKLANARAVARHRMFGPPPGSAERRRPARFRRARRRRDHTARRSTSQPVQGRSTELAAVGLFVLVASTVTLITLLIMLSQSPSDSTGQTGRSLADSRAVTVAVSGLNK